MRRLTSYGPTLLVVLTGVLVLMFTPRLARQITHAEQMEQVRIAREVLAGDLDVLLRIDEAHRAIAAIIEPSVVFISTESVGPNGRRPTASGSGWVYDDLGHIVTNHHVVADAQRIQVQFAGGWVTDATLIGSDPLTDVAVLLANDGPVLPARRGGDRSLQQGDQVFAYGAPFNFKGSLSKGIVSGTGRTTDQFPLRYQNYIQTDAAINRGNSGGPLLNSRAEVVGMNTFIATTPEGAATGVGFAIPMHTIESIADQIIDTGVVTRTVMGANLADIGTVDDLDAKRRMQNRGFEGRGVLVDYVFPGYPAAEAGLRTGDIITHLDGEPVSSVDVLRSTITSRRPGEVIALGVWRFYGDRPGGYAFDLSVELTQVTTNEIGLPEIVVQNDPRDNAMQAAARLALTGVGVLRLVDQPEQPPHGETPTRPAGARIQQMRSGSPAWERGLRTGQVITRVNGERVKGVYALLDALAEAHVQSPNQSTTLTVWDDANQETVVTLDFERWPAEREESRP
jgi:S1-C subfamily serine protease